MIITILVLQEWLHGQALVDYDWGFQASEVDEIYRNLKEGVVFAFVATLTFQRTGVTNFLFYPNFFLYPWAVYAILNLFQCFTFGNH